MKISNIISEQGVSEARASSAAFRSSNARRGELNAMSPEERKAHEDKRAEQQRKRDDARLERERAKNVAEATMTPDQIAAAKAAAPYGYNPQTGKPNPAPAGTAPSAAKTAQAFNTLAAQSPQQGADRQARLDAWKASQGIAVPARTPAAQPAAPAAQPAAAPAVDQAAIDRQAAKFGLPPGSTKEELVAAIQSKSFSKPPAAPAAPAQAPAAQAQPAKPAPAKGAVGQAAIAADAAGQNADAAALAAMQKKNPKLAAMMAQAGMNADGTDIAEAKKKEKEADYGDDYQDMVSRVKKLAGLGPLKTVYDPTKRVYKNMPTAVQPKK